MRWGEYPEFSVWRGRLKVRIRERFEEGYVAEKDRGRGHRPRNAGGLQMLKKARKQSPLQPPEGVVPVGTDFSPVRLRWTSDLQTIRE